LPRGKNETEDNSPYDKLSSEEMQTVQEQLELKRKNPYHQVQIPKANFVKVSSIRDIKKFLTFNYEDLRYRTILISDSHLMNEESQNALLKNLEEPPEGIIFILTTPYPALLRETIRSRCWQVNFHPLKPEDIKRVLVGYFSIEPKSAEITSLFANGSVISALKLLDNDLESLLERTISFLRYSFGRKINSAMKQLTDIIEENDPEIFKLLIQLVITWLNDVQKYRAGIMELAFRNHIETIEKFSTKFPDADIVSTAATLEYFVSLLINNVNINILLLNTIYALQNLTSRKTDPE
jgi:DNA polymerase III subunit delta'